MPRDIPVGNRKLLVTFDRHYRIRDFYFPNVGKENHTDGSPDAASRFCLAFGEMDLASRHARAPAEMITPDAGGGFLVDPVVDASLFGLFAFGPYEARDPRVAFILKAVEDRLWVGTDVGGLARYEGDYYHRVSREVPRNPWLLPSGVLAEQVDPFRNAPLSVSPLTWSHATLVVAVMEYLEKLEGLRRRVSCGSSSYRPDIRRRGPRSRPDCVDPGDMRRRSGPLPLAR